MVISDKATFMVHSTICIFKNCFAIDKCNNKNKKFLFEEARKGFQLRAHDVHLSCIDTCQLIFQSKSSAHSSPEMKIPRKIAQTGNKSCIKYSSLSQKFVQ